MLDRPFLSRFSPQRTDPEALEKILVQRHDLLAESVERIRDSVLTDNKHHLLFIGPRGIGKTNLVSLIVHRLKKLPKLQTKMRLAWLNEDETATSFLKLLILIYRDLTQRYPDEFPAADLQRVYGHKPDQARELLGASLLEHLGKRTIVVIMENLDSLFKDMPVEEQRTWRAFVQNHPVFATVGTAQSLFDGVSERTEPFFGFFDTRHLDNLTVDEAITLLRNVAKLNRDDKLEAYLATPTGHARVQAIHDLAGGNPRIYMVFSSFLTVEMLDDLVRPFEETADQQLTSYYQERLRWLSAQQREIVQYLCHQRFPVPVKQIAEGMFASHQTIANQLKILRDYRYVRGNERGREVLYELSEPLMRLALQVKETHDRKPLSLIVDFLRVWYDKSDIEEWLVRLPSEVAARAYFEAALELINSDEPNLRHEILRRCLCELNYDRCDDDTISTMQCLATESGLAPDWIRLGATLMQRRRSDDAIAAYSRAIAISDGDSDHVCLVGAYASRALALLMSDQHSRAIADSNRSLELASERSSEDQTMATAWTSVFATKERSGDYSGAFDALNKIVGYSADLPARRRFALGQRAGYYASQGKYEEAFRDVSFVIDDDEVEPEELAAALALRASVATKLKDAATARSDLEKIALLQSAPFQHLCKALLVLASIKVAEAKHDAALADIDRLFSTAREEGDHAWLTKMAHWPAEIVVGAVFLRGMNFELWTTEVCRFVPRFAAFGILGALGEALVQHLPTLGAGHLTPKAYDAWAVAWTAAADSLKSEDRQQLEIPLRLLRTGIAYYKTKDEGVLLSLPSEERKILRQVLKLDPEPAA